MINLALNGFSNQDVEAFDEFLSRQGDSFQLVLGGNNFDQKSIEKLKNNHSHKVLI